MVQMADGRRAPLETKIHTLRANKHYIYCAKWAIVEGIYEAQFTCEWKAWLLALRGDCGRGETNQSTTEPLCPCPSSECVRAFQPNAVCPVYIKNFIRQVSCPGDALSTVHDKEFH